MAVVAVLALAGGGAAAAHYWPRPQAQVQAAELERPRSPERGLLAFEPFVANLADPGTSRFLRVNLQLVVSNPKAAEKLEKGAVPLVQARAAILDTLMAQTADALATVEGKTAVKKAIIERVTPLFEEFRVVDVLFTDFVIQY
jgi:flagellar FliL protein